jgi:quinol-cytochrome oxidoreductase complex cytochrome b subunit
MSARAWLEERIPVSLEALKAAGNEPVPGHLKVWWFALGGTAAMLFFGQIATGLLLCVYYQPTPERAWESVRYITGQVPFGWWIRSLHKWGANLMIVAVALHLMRVFFTGAYRKPREANWIVGVTLLLITLVLGFTGYSIVYEQLSYWGATVAANITEAVPLIGPGLARTLRGGEQIGAPTLSRFFILHAAILPSVLLLVFAVHVALIRAHGVTEFPLRDEPRPASYPFIPEHVLKELGTGLALITVVNCLSVLLPVGIGPPADPVNTPEHIKPEWYFYFTFRWLKLSSLRAGIAGVSVAIGLLYVWPFIDWAIRRKRPSSELSMLFGAAAVIVFVFFTVWEGLS